MGRGSTRTLSFKVFPCWLPFYSASRVSLCHGVAGTASIHCFTTLAWRLVELDLSDSLSMDLALVILFFLPLTEMGIAFGALGDTTVFCRKEGIQVRSG